MLRQNVRVVIIDNSGTSRRRNRAGIYASATLGCLALAVSAVLLLIVAPSRFDEGRDFNAARPCAAHGGDDCLRSVPGTVAEITTHDKPKGNDYYQLVFVEAGGQRRGVTFSGSPAEAPVASVGQDIELTYWRGQARFADYPSGRKYSQADPRDDYGAPMAWGLPAGIMGLYGMWSWLWWAKLSHLSRRRSPWQLWVPMLGCGVVAGVAGFAAMTAGSMGAAWLVTGASALVMLVVSPMIGLIAWWRQRGDDTVAMEPLVPTGERVFAGAVRGEIPYASHGAPLVAGPGFLAVSIEPAGALLHRQLPPSLAPVRVRPEYWTDPGAGLADKKTKPLVLECEDNGVPVFITADRKDLPWVLGALQSRALTAPAAARRP
ncbi:hypothetical protein [Streptomyces sp. NPDC050738]|uniref:hypothetical protein n=1 Tax=Streptomyces sp. NPDC050738 TaxID=3154744 RepID=UPI0034375F43